MTAVIRHPGNERAAIYCRVSSSKQEDNTSLGEQQSGCVEWCAARTYTLDPRHTFIEVGQGDDYFVRPSFQALRAAMRAGALDVVVFFRLDRTVARGGQLHWHAFQMEALEAGVRLECVSEPERDLNAYANASDAGPEDDVEDLRAFMDNFKARREKADLIARTGGGRRERARAGKLLPGNLPKYGYIWGDAGPSARGGERKTTYLPDPVTAPVVALIYQLAADGWATRRIVDSLNAQGIPSPAQARAAAGHLTAKHAAHLETHATGRWGRTSVQRILRDETYQGIGVAFAQQVRRVRERDRATGQWRIRCVRVRRASDDPTRVRLPAGTIPPLVDDALATAARARLTEDAHLYVGHTSDPEAGLVRGGFARCGYCGGRLTYLAHGGHRGKSAVYKCSTFTYDKGRCPHGHSMRADRLDALVWQAVGHFLTTPSLYAAHVAGLRRSGGRAQAEGAAAVRATEDSLAQLASRRAPLLARLERASDAGEAAEIEGRLDSLAAQVRAQETVLRQRQVAAEGATASVEQVADFERWAAVEAVGLERLTQEERRARLRKLDVQVTLWHTTHQPHRLEMTFFSGAYAAIGATVTQVRAHVAAQVAAGVAVDPSAEEHLAYMEALLRDTTLAVPGVPTGGPGLPAPTAPMGGGERPSNSQSGPAVHPAAAATGSAVVPAGAVAPPPTVVFSPSSDAVS